MMIDVIILAFDEMELLDFAGPYEVFTTATRVLRNAGQTQGFRVRNVTSEGQRVQARAGLGVSPDAGIQFVTRCDVLIVPGGVITALMDNALVIQWLANIHLTTQLTASICTGAFLLAQAGILHEAATTHWEDLEDLRKAFPNLEVKEQVRWVQQDKVWSSAGISAGIDLSLHLVGKLLGMEWADKTARQMDYVGNWHTAS